MGAKIGSLIYHVGNELTNKWVWSSSFRLILLLIERLGRQTAPLWNRHYQLHSMTPTLQSETHYLTNLWPKT